MDKHENTFPFRSNIIINRERVTFIPKDGDQYEIFKDKKSAEKAANEWFGIQVDLTPLTGILYSSSMDIPAGGGENVVRCYPLEISGQKYDFIGFGKKEDIVRWFFLYKTD